jgi:WD40 repeat protein
MAIPYTVRLAISQSSSGFRVELFTEDLGDTIGQTLPLDVWETAKVGGVPIAEWLAFLQRNAPDLTQERGVELGRCLFEHLLGRDENLRKWQQVLERAKQQQRQVRLLIDAASQSGDLPFGLLHDSTSRVNVSLFRRTDPSVGFVRIFRQCSPRRIDLRRNPLRLLLAAAEPPGDFIPDVNSHQYVRKLAEQLAAFPRYELLMCSEGKIVPVEHALKAPKNEWKKRFCSVHLSDLRAALVGGDFDLFHLVAHGSPGRIVLGDGQAEFITQQELGECCAANKQYPLSVAFLQICKASMGAEHGTFGGLAQQLLDNEGGNVGAVIASAYPVHVAQSTEMANEFYKGLALGEEREIDLNALLARTGTFDHWAWAFLELWVRPGGNGTFQFPRPYRGLERFEERDHDIFHGRDAESTEILGLLRDHSAVAVFGDSGSGKSSLLQAGVAHRVREDGLLDLPSWRIVSFQPGAQPLLSLNETLSTVAQAEEPTLLLVDPGEELFASTIPEDERQKVARFLLQTARLHQQQFRLVLAVRTDRLGPLLAMPGWSEWLRAYPLNPPAPANIKAIVKQPAYDYRFTFEGSQHEGDPKDHRSLVNLLFDDLAKLGDSTDEAAPLPLLEFALERLWYEAVQDDSSEFKIEHYLAIGRLGGAIAHHADMVYDGLPQTTGLGDEAKSLVERIFTRLVNVKGALTPRSRPDLEREGRNPEMTRKVIDVLVRQRLLTIRAAPDAPGKPLLALTHTALTKHWGKLKKWLDSNQERRALREEFEEAAKTWSRGRPGFSPHSPSLLPSKRAAKRFLDYGRKPDDALRDEQPAFVEALTAMIRWANMFQVGVIAVSGLAILAVVLAIVAWQGWGAAQSNAVQEAEQRKRAETEKKAAVEARGVAEKAKEEANKSRGIAEEARKGEERQRGIAESLLYGRSLEGVYSAWRENDIPRAARILQDCKPKLPPWDKQAPWEWRHLYHLCHAELLTLQGHTGSVHGVCFSPDGKRIASASADQTVKVWDAQTGTEFRSLKGHTAPVYGVCFSPDSKRIASASSYWEGGIEKGEVKVWDAESGHEVLSLKKGHLTWVNSVAFSPDGKRLASGGIVLDGVNLKGGVKVWDAESGREVLTLKWHAGSVTSVAFSPDGKRIASASMAWNLQKMQDAFGEVKVWDAESGRELLSLKEHAANVTSVAFSPDGKRITTGCGSTGKAGDVRVWDLQTGKEVLTLKGHTGPVTSVCFSPDGQRLASGSGEPLSSRLGEVKVWDAHSGQQLLTFKGHTQGVSSIAFSPDGRRLASGAEALRQPGEVKVWDAHSGQQLLLVRERTDLSAVAFSPDGKRIASAPDDKSYVASLLRHILKERVLNREVKVWDTESGREVLALKGHTGWVMSVAFSPDGKYLGSGGSEGKTLNEEVKVWDAESGREIRTLKGRHTGVATSVAFSPDGTRLASGSGDFLNPHKPGEVRVWDARTGKLVHTLQGHKSQVTSVAFSPDGRRIASAGGFMQGRQGRDGNSEALADKLFAIAGGLFMREEASKGEVKLWDAESGHEVLTLGGQIAGVTEVAFSPDGQRLAGGCWDGTVKVWDSHSGQQLLVLNGRTNGVSSVAFSPGGSDPRTMGQRIVSGSYDGTVKVWDAQTGQLLLDLKGHTGSVASVAFSPDCTRLASGGSFQEGASTQGEVRVWDTTIRWDDTGAARRAWHQQQAREAEQGGQWFAAAFHLNRLTMQEPANPSLHLRLSLAHAAQGHWIQALVEFGWAVRLALKKPGSSPRKP